ncbi:MAG: tRNA uridine-5-carboxymethylaminomethyl(34) synthesis GTPase MnmE [Lysobacteraceae bacterium]
MTASQRTSSGLESKKTDTIVAIATAPGRGGVGIVRVSGSLVADIASALIGRAPTPRHAHYATFRDANGDTIDDGIALFFPGPRSFTGEDVLELQGHGAPLLLDRLQAGCIELGARAARPGEFSERAFLNGRMDLAQAEAVADLIAAGSEAAVRAARRSLDGVFSARVNELVASLTRLRVHVEAAIDFPEEEIDFLDDPQLLERLDETESLLEKLQHDAARGVRLNRGLHAVILGPPNAGKSSLLNALAGSERAIVTEIAGTTRDLLREVISLDGIELTLVDSAGLRESDDAVEQEGVRRARAELDAADLVLAVIDDRQGDAAMIALVKQLRADRSDLGAEHGPKLLRIHNQIDRSDSVARVESGNADALGPQLWLSAKTGDGIPALIDQLILAAGHDAASTANTFSARQRHLDAIERASQHLDAARQRLVIDAAGELAAEELRLAQQSLGEITGDVSSDDLLGHIFTSFCIGK